MRTEAVTLKLTMKEASRLGMRMFRNNVGLFKTIDGRTVKTGLIKGSADLIGWTPDGRFASIEVKSPNGKPSPEQINWMEQVQASGGFACIINDEKKLKNLLTSYMEMR
jgi:hypothetical protein